MKFIAHIATSTQRYDVHLEVGDDDAGRARVAEALQDLQEQFIPREVQPKKPAQRTAAVSALRPPAAGGGEAQRDT